MFGVFWKEKPYSAGFFLVEISHCGRKGAKKLAKNYFAK